MAGTQRTSQARAELAGLAREVFDVDDNDTSRSAQARRELAAIAPELARLDAMPRGSVRANPRRRVAGTVITLVAGGVVTLAVVQAVQVIDAHRIARNESASTPAPQVPSIATVVPPMFDSWNLPTRTEDPTVTQTVATAVVAYQAEQQRLADEAAAAEAAAAAAAATAAQAQQSTTGATSTGGKTGGTTGGGTTGGGTVAPPPAPAAYVSSISFHATTGTGVISITANIQTSGSMSAGVTCSANGTGISLAGPDTVSGAASYSGSFTGLAAGTYNVSCAAGGVTSSSTTLEVY